MTTITIDPSHAQPMMQEAPRKLRPGDLVDVRIWPKKDDKSGGQVFTSGGDGFTCTSGLPVSRLRRVRVFIEFRSQHGKQPAAASS